jgi:L,D-transpeptidase ErfK/SrfK
VYRCVLAVLLVILQAGAAGAGGAYSYSNEKTVVGSARDYTVNNNESLHEIARKFDLGYNEVTAANPEVDPWVPPQGSEVNIPSWWVLPDAPRKGIVINLAEMRLYHYMDIKGRKLVKTYPIGVGKEGFDTPTGIFKVMKKHVNPSWYVPESIRGEQPELPSVVPPGEDNPLGSYALRLNEREYLIHGTNMPYGVGRRVSHGCIRLYPEDIEDLHRTAHVGTAVTIVYQPIKVGLRGGTAYVEAHEDYLNKVESPLTQTVSMLRKLNLLERADIDLIRKAVKARKGIPIPIS